MVYKPNYNNRAFRARALKAIQFVEQYVKDTPNWLSTRWIHHRLHFGGQTNPISQWLRQQLLIEVDQHYNMQSGKCKTYRINHQGLALLKQNLNIQSYEPQLTPSQQQQLQSGDFTWTLKNHRYYNDLQFLPTNIRRPLLSQYGYRYNYDIVCAAPTLLRQYADQLGFTGTTPALDQYIHERARIRHELAQALAVTERQAKQIIHAMINGGHIGTNPRWRIYQLVNYDSSKIQWLQQDNYIQTLKQEIRECWLWIRQHHSKTYRRFDGRAKSEVYRSLEYLVMRAVYRELKTQGITNPFREHDGWRCNQLVDQLSLRAAVKKKTGYVIDFDYEVCEYV